MPKVVTGTGLADFVQSGKPTETFKTEPKAAPKPQPDANNPPPPPPIQAAAVVTPPAEVKPPPAPPVADDDPAAGDAETREEMGRSEKVTKIIGKKHQAMRAAQEAAQEAESFAESQFNRAKAAEKRAADAEAALAAARQAAPPAAPPPENKKPDAKDPKFFDEKGQFKGVEYAEALSTWAAQEAVAKDRAEQETARRAAAAAEAERVAKDRVAAAKAQHQDYDEVLKAGGDVILPGAVLEYLTVSENIGELVYHLAKNPDIAKRLNAMHPYAALAEIGRIEQTLKPAPKPAAPPNGADGTPEPGRVAGAPPPPPIVPLNTNAAGHVQTDPAKMNFKELREYERGRARATGRRH